MFNCCWRHNPSIWPDQKSHDRNIKVEFPLTVSVYPPTAFFGRLFRMICDEHPIWEISQSSVNTDDYLSDSLRPSPLPTLTDHIKYWTLCSKPMIWILRRSLVKASPQYLSTDVKRFIQELPIDQSYNFVLLGDGRVVLSPISLNKWKCPYRLLCKHIVLAKDSINVRFAGEIRKKNDDDILFINNDSGTYRPDVSLTSEAVAYFQRLFPDLSIREISRR